MTERQTLLEFPCAFAIKAMGLADREFENTVIDIVRRHAPDFDDRTLRKRASRNGKYVAITLTIHARNRRQLDAIYTELGAHRQVLMAL